MPPAVVGNVMLRWESIVLWLFYPRMGLGNELDPDTGMLAAGTVGCDVFSADI